jgi:hypothetical protein
MNRPILFDAKQSREILKAIRYGMELRLDPWPQGEVGERFKIKLGKLAAKL